MNALRKIVVVVVFFFERGGMGQAVLLFHPFAT